MYNNDRDDQRRYDWIHEQLQAKDIKLSLDYYLPPTEQHCTEQLDTGQVDWRDDTMHSDRSVLTM